MTVADPNRAGRVMNGWMNSAARLWMKTQWSQSATREGRAQEREQHNQRRACSAAPTRNFERPRCLNGCGWKQPMLSILLLAWMASALLLASIIFAWSRQCFGTDQKQLSPTQLSSDHARSWPSLSTCSSGLSTCLPDLPACAHAPASIKGDCSTIRPDIPLRNAFLSDLRRQQTRERAVVVDVGANDGTFTRYLANIRARVAPMHSVHFVLMDPQPRVRGDAHNPRSLVE